jgi:hypothetical protein
MTTVSSTTRAWLKGDGVGGSERQEVPVAEGPYHVIGL